MNARTIRLVIAALAMTITIITGIPPTPAAADTNDPQLIVSLGDSFIAGNGNGNYYPGQGPGHGDGPAGSPRTSDRGNCWQSHSSYPWQLTERINDTRGDGSAFIWHEACGGSKIEDLRPQWNRVPADWQDAADIVLISIGGNDLGFGEIARACIVQLPTVAGCPSALDYAETEIGNVMSLIKIQIQWLMNQTDAHIVLVGYPDLSDPGCGGSYVEPFKERLGALLDTHDAKARSIVDDLTRPPLLNRVHWVPAESAWAGKGSPCAVGNNAGYIQSWIGVGDGEAIHPTWKGANLYASTLWAYNIQNLHSPTNFAQVPGTGPAPVTPDPNPGGTDEPTPQPELNWLAVLSEDGRVFAKSERLDSGWVEIAGPGVEELLFEGDRILIRWPNGTVHAKEGRLDAPWVTLASTAISMDADGDRIGVVSSNGSTYVKEGGLDAPWVRVAGAVSAQVHLEGDRIAVVKADGTVWMKEGGLDARWVKMTGAWVESVALEGDRVYVWRHGGTVYAKDGGLSSSWVRLTSGVADVQADGNRVMVLHTDGVVHAKDGSLSSSWVPLTGAWVDEIDVEGDRVFVRSRGGKVFAKEGSLSSSWLELTSGAVAVEAAGDRVMVLHTDGVVHAKDGSLSSSWVRLTGAWVDQIELLPVD